MAERKKINYLKLELGPFYFQKLGEKYLLTNDIGNYVFLSENDFEKLVSGEINKKSSLYKELSKKNFISSKINFAQYINQYRERYHYLFQGPSLHIVVLTLRCNHRCVYCQASPKDLKEKHFDLNESTAKKIVDFIFSTPSPFITIEFQGGEPFLNWETLKFIVKYALTVNKIQKRNLLLTVVSNLTLLDDQKIKFLLDHKVSVATSLDGPENVHNFNRRFLSGNSYRAVVLGIKKLQKAYKKRPSIQRNFVNAIMTTTSYSLKYPKEIVNEYLKLNFNNIFLRPLSPFGLAKKIWRKIGYSPEEYLKFYKEALDYIIKLNLKGKKFWERTAVIFLKKILTKKDPNFLDIRSPCGAGIGQLAYDYNGDIYTCDEGRMLAQMGDFSFKLGNVHEVKYHQVINNPTIKIMALASCLENLPMCAECVFKPYCGICPLFNYAHEGNLFSQIPNNLHCKINKGILEYLFERLTNSKIKSIFKKWVNEKNE